jgi:hypothetical protein
VVVVAVLEALVVEAAVAVALVVVGRYKTVGLFYLYNNLQMIKFLIGIFLFSSVTVFAQAPSSIKFYLASKQISKNAKDYYYNKFMAIDNERTFSIIDSLESKNNTTRPFYIFLVSRMLKKADGALSEAMGVRCKKFIESNPDFLIEFLFSKSKMIENNFLFEWVSQLYMEFSIDCDEYSVKCTKQSLSKALKKVKLTNVAKLKFIYQKIEKFHF